MSRKGLVLSIGMACSVLLLALGCQPTQPVPLGTPKAGEKAAATPTKAAEKAAEKPVRGGTLRLIMLSDPSSLDPNSMTMQAPMYSIYERLLEPDKDGNVTKEGLTKDWTVSADGKTITFKLREGVKFQDGTDFDAAAVKSNIDRMKDPATKSPFREYYEAVASVEVVDGLTVRFSLKQPDVLLLPRLAGVGGMMVSPAAVKKYGQDYPRNPVGIGPFQFVEWVAGDRITLKRFDGYWKKDKEGNQLPYLDRVVVQFITDPTTVVANLRTGQIDLYNDFQMPAEQRRLIEADPNLTLLARPGPVSRGVTMNTKKPPFDSKALRQAVALAVDREGMAAGVRSPAQATLFNPIDKAFDDGKSGVFPPRDAAKAKAKMAEAGYSAGGLKVKFTGQTAPEIVLAAQILKANLAEIGIEVEIEAVAGAAWNTKVRVNWDYQMSLTTTNTAIGDPGQYFGNQFHSRGTRNYFGPYNNPQVDQALDKAFMTYDQKARAALYSEAAKLILEDAPFVPVYVTDLATGMSKKVRNYVQYFDIHEYTRDVWLAQ